LPAPGRGCTNINSGYNCPIPNCPIPNTQLPPFPFTLIRSRRKTVALIVQRDGTLVVRAPLRAPRRQIDELVAQKADWVRQKQAYARAHAPATPHRFASGERFWFLGKEYLLEVVESLTTALTGCFAKAQRHRDFKKFFSVSLCLCGSNLPAQTERFLLERKALPRAAEAFTAWYKAQARALIEERVRSFAARYGFTYKQLKITSARTRWGSCSSRGTLSFTWRLVMAPPECIDYVVVHELAHLRVANHSPAFWREVGAILPDFKERRKWLRVNGRLLTLD